MRVGSKVMAAALAASVALPMLPSAVTDDLRQEWRRLAGDPGQACFDHERQSLADPDGARFDSQTVGVPDANAITIRYRADTGDGPDVVVDTTCALRGARFSAEDTALRREHATAARRFDALRVEFDCLEGRKALLRAGKVDEASRRKCSR